MSDQINLFWVILAICSSEIVDPLQGGKNHSSFSSLPPTLAVCLGYLLKNPLFLCIRKRPGSQGEGSVWG